MPGSSREEALTAALRDTAAALRRMPSGPEQITPTASAPTPSPPAPRAPVIAAAPDPPPTPPKEQSPQPTGIRTSPRNSKPNSRHNVFEAHAARAHGAGTTSRPRGHQGALL